jgi:hypothetical protein
MGAGMGFGSELGCVVGILLAVAAMVLLFSAIQWLIGLLTLRWPTTPGIVLDSYIEEGNMKGGRGGRPIVEYQYEVNGKTYRNNRIYVGSNTAMSAGGFSDILIQLEARRYPAGKQVTVRYDPANPANAILESRAGFIAPGIGVLLLVIAIALPFIPATLLDRLR